MIVVQAKADTTQGNFIFDTGAQGLVLNNTYFRDYPVNADQDAHQRGITGDGDQLQHTTVETFRMGSMSFFRADAELVSLARLEQSKGIKILGLLGVSLFEECEVMVDYKNNKLLIYHINKKEVKTYHHALLSDSSAYHSFPLDMKDNRLRIKTKLAGRDLSFVIDYAAESTVLDSRVPDKISDSVNIDGRILLTGVGTKQLEALSGRISGLQMGDLALPQLPVIITRLKNTCFGSLDCIDGVLGYDFLSSYRIIINFRKRILYIIK